MVVVGIMQGAISSFPLVHDGSMSLVGIGQLQHKKEECLHSEYDRLLPSQPLSITFQTQALPSHSTHTVIIIPAPIHTSIHVINRMGW